MPLKLKHHSNWNVNETKISLKINITKYEMSLNLYIIKTVMSIKFKYQIKWNVTKTEISLK